jgi:VWFA-related protein
LLSLAAGRAPDCERKTRSLRRVQIVRKCPSTSNTPKLKIRPIPQHPSEPETRIHLDVVVSDKSGQPVAGLYKKDFALLDDKLQRDIVTFQAVDARRAKPDPPVQAILLIDQVNPTFQQVSFARSEIARLLRKNDGRLPLPVSIAVLSESGLRMQRSPSVDGNACLAVLDQVKGNAANLDARLSKLSGADKSALSFQQLTKLAGIESRKPGRKLLIWMGRGWQIQPDSVGGDDQHRIFNSIIEISRLLRQAHTAVYSVSSDNPISNVIGLNQTADLDAVALISDYQLFLKPVRVSKQATLSNLDLRVLANNTGGRILGPHNDLVRQIEQCIRDAQIFYRISFDPPPAEREHEYHDMHIRLSRSGLNARTSVGYYNEPAQN